MMKNKFPRIIYFLICFLLVFEQSGFAQSTGQLDVSGYFSALGNSLSTDKFRPVHLRYLSYDKLDNSFKLLLDKGDSRQLPETVLKDSARELLSYFFTGITLPNDSFWVNLRPDSADNIIDDYLVQTEAGRILLEADVQLKKDTAAYTSPQTPEGKQYWDKLYRKAEELLGADNITIPTLVRPWIVPDEIIIGEAENNAYIYKATLKVLLEDDYLKNSANYNFQDPRLKTLNEYSSRLIKDEIIPKLTKEVNTSKRYASLRQVYYSLILAQWFKARFSGKGGICSLRIDKRDLTGLISTGSWSKQQYFQQYQSSFKDGEYKFKESVQTLYGRSVRRYFSGGIQLVPEQSFPQRPTGPDPAISDPYSVINAKRSLQGDIASKKDYLVGMSSSSAGEVNITKEPAISFLGSSSASNIYEVVMEYIGMAPDKKITFADFMNIAQGHPKYGYYASRAKIEKDVDDGFLTFAEGKEGELLAQAISNHLMQKWLMLGQPSVFTIVEMGAGNGTLAFNILNQLKEQDKKFPATEPTLYKALRYVIVEISQANLKITQEKKLGEFQGKVSWVGSDARNLASLRQEYGLITGAFLSNELPDDFGIHRVRFDAVGQPQELYVAVDNNGMLHDVPGPLSDPRINTYLDYLKKNGIELKAGKEIAVNLESLDWQDEMERSLERGEIITIDYAFGDLSQQHHRLEAERDFAKEGDAVWSGKYSGMGVEEIYQKVRDSEPVNITSLVDFGYLSGQYVSRYNYSGIFDQADFIEKGGFVEGGSAKKTSRVVIHLSDGQWMKMSPFKVLIQLRTTPLAQDKPVSSPAEEFARQEISGPFINFMRWFDGILQESGNILGREEMEDIASQLGISPSIFVDLYNNAMLQAQLAHKFAGALKDDGKENIFLFRDSFALYAAEKLKNKPAQGLFLSKATFRFFFGSIAGDGVIHFMFQSIKKEMGYDRDEAVAAEDFPEFKLRFFNLLSGLMNQENPGNEKAYGQFDGYGNNLRQAAEKALLYLSSVGLDMESIKRKGVRFIDTTLTGSIVLFLEGVIYDQLRKQGLSEADALKKTDSFMFYSRLSEALRFSGLEQQGRAVENTFYPIEFDRKAGLDSNNQPIVIEKSEQKNKFLLQVFILRNELIKLNAEEAVNPSGQDDPGGTPVGGIDLRSLPLVARLGLNRQLGSLAVPAQLVGINLDASWAQIDNMLKAGIIPSSERVKEYLWACSEHKNISLEMGKVLDCIADMLRMQEDLALNTDLSLKEMLALLDSGKPDAEMRFILARL
ncbi:MAG: SAM-dependent methyltransferase [Candidatus Omnitrophica bacterium]|jgi:SAM-dependent MidA family methyltransferase|nr:SAM-dependent methyltransferase [Candidatus Omnitrophota bacterium]